MVIQMWSQRQALLAARVVSVSRNVATVCLFICFKIVLHLSPVDFRFEFGKEAIVYSCESLHVIYLITLSYLDARIHPPNKVPRLA